MTRRHCDTGRTECPHLPECVWECHYDNAKLEPMTRKVKPYPIVPEDIEPVSDTWHTVGTVMLTAIMGALAVVCILIFFTGVWVWSLLI
jgi:hypothetical protein